MDPSAISLILQELNLNEDCVTNIYNHGSWVYGTNSSTSDRDLIFVTRSLYQNPLRFKSDFDYFNEFELHKLWNQYDVCVYSIENFQTLLEKNSLVVVQCIFLPDEFKIKEEVDFRPIYLEKYYNTLRLKQVAFYEMNRDLNMYDSNNCSNHPIYFVEQLIQTKSIHNFKRVSHILGEMRDIRDDPTDNSSMERVVKFVRTKSVEFKSKLDALVPTNIIKGAFEAHITFDCATSCSEQIIDKLKATCENTKYKIVFIQLDTYRDKDTFQQLMVSSHYYGEYPLIVKQIEEEVYQYFHDFNIIRIKIKSLAFNEGIPRKDIDKILFWDKTPNYFEFHYKVLVKRDRKGDKLKELRDVCEPYGRFKLHLSRNAFKQIDEKNFHYMITMRLFDVGRENAFTKSNEVVEYLIRNDFPPLKVIREFIVYDTHIELDNDWI